MHDDGHVVTAAAGPRGPWRSRRTTVLQAGTDTRSRRQDHHRMGTVSQQLWWRFRRARRNTAIPAARNTAPATAARMAAVGTVSSEASVEFDPVATAGGACPRAVEGSGVERGAAVGNGLGFGADFALRTSTSGETSRGPGSDVDWSARRGLTMPYPTSSLGVGSSGNRMTVSNGRRMTWLAVRSGGADHSPNQGLKSRSCGVRACSRTKISLAVVAARDGREVPAAMLFCRFGRARIRCRVDPV
ncbi:hypothetical protein EHYA_09605 [Embleya hyalina]|uniref:Uncharacterized protein n=1 Tax=Embleya hyalina TaxID=516124 RepID=A0A401Z4Q0_9ACTN|nr:hypothetical protein EHYA_09605 [Embleya hyalina]